MKAVVCDVYGPTDVLQIRDVPKPVIRDDEFLVKVHYSTVNRTDTGMRSAKYFISRLFSGLFKPRFMNFGNEYAGEVVELGKNVTGFKLGDKVFGFDDVGFDCLAEYKAVGTKGLVALIPKGKSYKDVVATLEGAHYMLFYIRAAKIGKGTKVLVNGATGAIGSAAVQIMSHIGAEVTATADTKHIGLVNKLGANAVINRDEQDFTRLNTQFDVVFDSVGKSSFKACKNILTSNGIYMSTELGEYPIQNPLLALRSKLWGKQKVLFPIPKNILADAEYLRDLLEQGIFTPLIDRTYDLDDIVEATKYVESEQKVGNVLIRII